MEAYSVTGEALPVMPEETIVARLLIACGKAFVLTSSGYAGYYIKAADKAYLVVCARYMPQLDLWQAFVPLDDYRLDVLEDYCTSQHLQWTPEVTCSKGFDTEDRLPALRS
jgi:hypothetical protein